MGQKAWGLGCGFVWCAVVLLLLNPSTSRLESVGPVVDSVEESPSCNGRLMSDQHC